MSAKIKLHTGFTIVELLIVIVVIGILAAISIVSYSGIQNRADDTAVKSDLNNFGKKIELYFAEFGEYPTVWNGLETKATTGSYGAHYAGLHNLLYCRNYTVARIAAASKSGRVFVYKSGSGIAEYAGVLATNTTLCPALGVSTSPANGWAATWHYSNGFWSTLVQ